MATTPLLSGKVAIVTGASSGIGAGTAKLFSKLGAQVVLTGRNEDNLKKVAEECEKNGSNTLIVKADLTSESDVTSIVEETVKKFGKIDILVNNAGIYENGTIETTSLEQYDKIMNTNLRAVYQLTMLAVPHLVKTKGNIVNVSSLNGNRVVPNFLSYSLSKAGLDQFTKCVALELAPKKVRCNCVNPGIIKTEIFAKHGITGEVFENFIEKVGETYPLRRVGEVEDVASAIAFLASDTASFITGASSGIGAATAKLFSRLGAQLALTGRKEANLQEVAQECEKAGSKPLTIIADLTSEAETSSIVERTIKQYGKIDILVNNAGILEMDSIENTSLEQYDKMMNTNVRSLYQLTMLAVPHLVESKGNVVNVSSVNGVRAFQGVLSYCMSKSTVDQFTRCVALDLAAKQVRCNSVNPGVIITELQKRGGLSDEAYANFLERSKTTHPLGRPGNVEEVASAIAFLASDAASFITGVQLPVDGGRHAMCPR